MRTLVWCLGMLVLNAWGDVSRQLGHSVPAGWWGWLVMWTFLGLAAGAMHAARWAIGKYTAGVPAPSPGIHASAPAVIRKEQP